MKTPVNHATDWRIDDLIDFEFFLSEDRAASDSDLAARDRAIYAKDIRPLLTGAASDTRGKVRLWLEARRQEWRAAGKELPGQSFRDSYFFLLAVFGFAGLLMGKGLAAWHGDGPINALAFFLETVLIQVALIIAAGLGLLFSTRLRSPQGFAPVRGIVRFILTTCVDLKEMMGRHLSGEKRLHFRAIHGIIQAKRTIYGNLWLWPMVILTQTAIVCFNISILIMLLLLPRHYQFYAEATWGIRAPVISQFIHAMALPWSWLQGAPAAHDNPVFDEGWWAFLFCAVCVYGLLPRTVLLITACLKQKRALAALPFNQPDCNQLIRRMELMVVAGPSGPAMAGKGPVDAAAPQHDLGRCVTIVSSGDFPGAAPDRCLAKHGWQTWKRAEAEVDCADANGELYAMLRGIDWNGEQPKLTVVIDAARPPIKAITLFLQELRRTCGREALITVFLVAAANSKDEYSAIWKQRVAAMEDPYLNVECGTCDE